MAKDFRFVQPVLAQTSRYCSPSEHGLARAVELIGEQESLLPPSPLFPLKLSTFNPTEVK